LDRLQPLSAILRMPRPPVRRSFDHVIDEPRTGTCYWKIDRQKLKTVIKQIRTPAK